MRFVLFSALLCLIATLSFSQARVLRQLQQDRKTLGTERSLAEALSENDLVPQVDDEQQQQQQHDDETDELSCAVCFETISVERPDSSQLNQYTCTHAIQVCNDCTEEIKRRGPVVNCPVCRNVLNCAGEQNRLDTVRPRLQQARALPQGGRFNFHGIRQPALELHLLREMHPDSEMMP